MACAVFRCGLQDSGAAHATSCALGDAICASHAQGVGTDCTLSRLVAELYHRGPRLPSPLRQNISCTPIVWSTYGRPHQDTLTVGRSLSKSIARTRNFVPADVVCFTGCAQASRWRSGNGAHGLQAFLRHWARTSSLRLGVSLLSSLYCLLARVLLLWLLVGRSWFSSSWLLAPAPRSQSLPAGVPPWCHRRLGLRALGPLYLLSLACCPSVSLWHACAPHTVHSSLPSQSTRLTSMSSGERILLM